MSTRPINLSQLGSVGIVQGSLAAGSSIESVAAGGGSIGEIDFLPGPNKLGSLWLVESGSVLITWKSMANLVPGLTGLFLVPSNQNVITEGNLETTQADLSGRFLALPVDVFDSANPVYNPSAPFSVVQAAAIILKQPIIIPYGYIMRASIVGNNGNPVAATGFSANAIYRELMAC